MSFEVELRGEVFQVLAKKGGGYGVSVRNAEGTFYLSLAVPYLVDHVIMPYSRARIFVVLEAPMPDEQDMADMVEEQARFRQQREKEAENNG